MWTHPRINHFEWIKPVILIDLTDHYSYRISRLEAIAETKEDMIMTLNIHITSLQISCIKASSVVVFFLLVNAADILTMTVTFYLPPNAEKREISWWEIIISQMLNHRRWILIILLNFHLILSTSRISLRFKFWRIEIVVVKLFNF